MANEAYLYRLRADLGSGNVQITDLTPNTSRRPAVLKGQSGYLAPLRETADVVTGAPNPTVQDYVGLEAYLLDVVNDEVSTLQIASADAHAAAAAIIVLLDAGSPVTVDALNTIFVTTVGMGAGTMPFPYLEQPVAAGIASGGAQSLGTQADLMKACCGGEYTFPAGSTVDATAAHAAVEGSFSAGYRQLYMSGSFAASLAEGDLATITSATWTYASVTAQGAVAYSVAGTVLS